MSSDTGGPVRYWRLIMRSSPQRRPVTRRATVAAIAVGSFVIAWLAALRPDCFGSGNVLVWVIATVVGVGTYLALVWREQRAG